MIAIKIPSIKPYLVFHGKEIFHEIPINVSWPHQCKNWWGFLLRDVKPIIEPR